VKNKKQTEKLMKEIEDCLRYMIDEGFVKKKGDKYIMRSEKEIEKEIENVRKDS
jgi:hypothetical protein